jgi:hypothetical protein
MTIQQLLTEMPITDIKNFVKLKDAIDSDGIDEYIEIIQKKFEEIEKLNDDQKKRRIYKTFKDDLDLIKNHIDGVKKIPTFEKLDIEKLKKFYSVLSPKFKSMPLPPKGAKRESNESAINSIISKFLKNVNNNPKTYKLILDTEGTKIDKDQISKLKRDQSFRWSDEDGIAFEFESKKTNGLKEITSKKGLMFAEVEKKWSGLSRKQIQDIEDKDGSVSDHNFRIQTEWNDDILKQINQELNVGSRPYLLCGQTKEDNIYVIYPDQYHLKAVREDYSGALRIKIYAHLNEGINPSSILTLKEFLSRMLVSSVEIYLGDLLKEITLSGNVQGPLSQLTPEPINRLFGNKKKKKKRGSKCSK